jgi:hypothetical protein
MVRVYSLALVCLILASVPLVAQTVPLNTVDTDPIWNANIFYTQPPVLASDLHFVNTINAFGTTCYGGTTSTNSNCYSSNTNGAITIMNQSASDAFAGLILMATFPSAPTGLNGTIGSEHTSLASSQFAFQSGRTMGSGTTAGMTNQYNNGDFAYVFVRMADYFGGVNCGSNPNGAGCLLATNSSVTIPYSFVDLPANVIFNVYGVGIDQQVHDSNPNSSTSGILTGLVINGNTVTSVPEPATLMLVGGGCLTLLRLRSRRRRK